MRSDSHLAAFGRQARRATSATDREARASALHLAIAHARAALREIDADDSEIADALAESVAIVRTRGGRGLLALIEGGRRDDSR